MERSHAERDGQWATDWSPWTASPCAQPGRLGELEELRMDQFHRSLF